MAATNTPKSFRDKWARNPRLGVGLLEDESSEAFRWILERNGFSSPSALRRFLRDKRRILDAGCGNGRVTALLRRFAPAPARIVAIDLVAAAVARKNLSSLPRVEVRRADLLGNLSGLGAFDFIYCQEVLHHTGDPAKAFQNLCRLLAPGGEIAIYVYRRKAPIREFSDDFVRARISGLPYRKALAACEAFARLGKALSGLRASVKVPAIPALEIPAGTYDVQRFLYHFFLKCFWNPGYSFRENAVINYDWYHPQLCSRHAPEEVRGWFRANGLRVVQSRADFYGITMRGRRPRGRRNG